MRTYFLILLVLPFGFVYSQKNDNSLSDIEVQYEYSFVRDTTDTDPSHRLKELMILDFNPNSSIYYSQQYMAVKKNF
jgi:hypothetical protein